jgi:hypothetical protein
MSYKFQPTLVSDLEKLLERLITEEGDYPWHYEIKKNIAYNMQYLEYLAHTLSDESPIQLTDVVKKLTIRSFIITGMGIVEGLLYYILRKRNLHKKKKEDLIADNIKAEFKPVKNTGRKYYIKSQIFKILEGDEQTEDEMSLDSMLKRAEKYKILGEDNEIYRKLNYLRKLRNTVHIQLIEKKLDTHYNQFNDKELNIMKKILYSLLDKVGILETFSSSKKTFSYLK